MKISIVISRSTDPDKFVEQGAPSPPVGVKRRSRYRGRTAGMCVPPARRGIFCSGKRESMNSEIKRTFGLFLCLALNGMRINHRGSHITVTQQFLNRPNIIVGLQKMTCKTVTKRMRWCPLGNLWLSYRVFNQKNSSMLCIGVKRKFILIPRSFAAG